MKIFEALRSDEKINAIIILSGEKRALDIHELKWMRFYAANENA